MSQTLIPLYNEPVVRGENGQSPGFYEIVDQNIRSTLYVSEDIYITPLLHCMKLGLKETACIIFPKEFGYAYNLRYSK